MAKHTIGMVDGPRPLAAGASPVAGIRPMAGVVGPLTGGPRPMVAGPGPVAGIRPMAGVVGPLTGGPRPMVAGPSPVAGIRPMAGVVGTADWWAAPDGPWVREKPFLGSLFRNGR